MTRVLTLTIAAAVAAVVATAADAGTAGRIGRREWRQQQRIAQGIRSGQLTPRETVRLERRQVGLNREIGTMRRWNDGRLTPGERALVNRQQNRLSRGIYRLKHNGAVRHR